MLISRVVLNACLTVLRKLFFFASGLFPAILAVSWLRGDPEIPVFDLLAATAAFATLGFGTDWLQKRFEKLDDQGKSGNPR